MTASFYTYLILLHLLDPFIDTAENSMFDFYLFSLPARLASCQIQSLRGSSAIVLNVGSCNIQFGMVHDIALALVSRQCHQTLPDHVP